ncbi:MAG: SseB family protein [candidate division FCPU426 bacterium]
MNPLEALFAEAMRDPGKRGGFYAALLEADLYVGGSFRGPGEADLQFYDVDGEKVLPVFSDVGRLQRVLGPQAAWLKFKGRDILQTLRDRKPLVLNPFSEFGREFDEAELAEILEKY